MESLDHRVGLYLNLLDTARSFSKPIYSPPVMHRVLVFPYANYGLILKGTAHVRHKTKPRICSKVASHIKTKMPGPQKATPSVKDKLVGKITIT